MTHLTFKTNEKERIASGDMEALKEVLIRYRVENVDRLTNLATDLGIHQGAGQLVAEILDVFKLNVCLKETERPTRK